MNKLILITLCALALTSCKTNIKTEYVDKPIPIYLTPKPSKITKPIYAIDTLSLEDKKDPAKLSKAIATTAAQKNVYIEQLEKVYTTYDKLGDDSLVILERMKKINPDLDVGQTSVDVYMDLLKKYITDVK